MKEMTKKNPLIFIEVQSTIDGATAVVGQNSVDFSGILNTKCEISHHKSSLPSTLFFFFFKIFA